MKKILPWAVVGLLLIIVLTWWNQSSQPPQTIKTTTTSPSGSSLIGQPRPSFSLADVDGTMHTVNEWDGKVVMVNFWATWCPPCRKEIPAFIRLQEQYGDKGFIILGIAIDNHDAIIDFIDPMGVNYPILMGEHTGIDIAQRYGNRLSVLPYTVIIDRQGHIAYTHREELSFEQAEKIIRPLL